MATRQREPISPRWPSVATSASLPNVAGSPTQSAYLQVGDECYVVAAAKVYVCTDATLNAALWAAPQGASPDYVPAQRPSTSSLYLFDGNLNDSGPAGRNLTALVGTIRYVPLRTGTRRFAQVASGAVCFAQASNAWTDAVYPVTIEGVVNTTLCNGLTSSGGVIANLSNAAAPSGTVWAMRVMNDYTVSLYYYDSGNVLRELVSTSYVPSVGDCVIHGVISVSGGDTTLTIYINGLASGTTTFAGNIPRAVANQRASIMGWLDGSAQWGHTHPRPFYACHLMLEALDAATCLARSQQILGSSTS